MWAFGLDWAGPGQGQVAYACECGNEPSGSVKCGELLDQLQASQLLRKDSAPWSEKVSGGRQFSRLLAGEVCASTVVMVVMLDTPCSEVECKTTGYPLHSTPLHFTYLASPCAIRFHLSSTIITDKRSLMGCQAPSLSDGISRRFERSSHLHFQSQATWN